MRRPHEPFRLVIETRPPRGCRQRLDERTRHPRQRSERVGEEVRGVRVVAPKELVSALAGKCDLDVVACELRDEVGRQRGRIRERLVERVGERTQQELRIRLHE